MEGKTVARRKSGGGRSIRGTSLCDVRVVKTADATLLEASWGYTFKLQNTGWLKTVTFNFRILNDCDSQDIIGYDVNGRESSRSEVTGLI